MSPYITMSEISLIELTWERDCRTLKTVIIGDGGIGLELAHSLSNVEIVWCSKRNFGSKFLDPEAMDFLLNSSPAGEKQKTDANYGCTEFDRSDTIVKTVTPQAALGKNTLKFELVKIYD